MSLPAGLRPVPHAGNSHGPRQSNGGIRVVVTGKGGVGKTSLVALLAREFALRGKMVLAVDGDPQQNLAATLGLPGETAGRIVPVSESAAYIREKTGAGPDISPGGLLALNPDVSDVIDRFAVRVAPGIRLLVMGGVRQAGAGCLCPAYTLLAAILRHMRLFDDDVILLDTPAGLEHFGRAVAEGFTCAVVVTDPSYNALSVARESAALARQLGIPHIILAVNRVHGDTDIQKVRGRLRDLGEFPRVIVVPFNPDIFLAEPDVTPLLAADSPFRNEIRRLAEMIAGRCEAESGMV